MDREISAEERRSRLTRRVVATVGAAAAVVIAFVAIVGWLSPSVRRSDLQFAPVTRGSVDGSVQASGIVLPEVEQVVSSPVEARVLRVGRRPGDRVKVGDELLTLDTAPVRLELSRLDQRLAQKDNEATQLRLKIEETVGTLRAQLEQRRLDGEIVRLKSDQTRTLRSEGLVSEQESLVAATAAKKTAIEITQLEQDIARARRTGDAQLAAAAIDLGMLRAEREESRRQLDLAMLRADRDGVITSIVQDEGTTIRRGDVVARIANLSSFRVTATISDLYVSRLATGMRARVKLDASNFVGGVLTSIDPRIENGVARLNVTLDPAAHARLRNNIRVDVDIITGSRADVLRLRRGALGQSPTEEVFVVRGDRLVRRRVRYGFIGSDSLEISEGLTEGDSVVTSDMTDYEGVKELRLK
jgi:HlyD family secretion protein